MNTVMQKIMLGGICLDISNECCDIKVNLNDLLQANDKKKKKKQTELGKLMKHLKELIFLSNIRKKVNIQLKNGNKNMVVMIQMILKNFIRKSKIILLNNKILLSNPETNYYYSLIFYIHLAICMN